MRAGEVRAYEPVALDERRRVYVWGLLCEKLEGLQKGVLSALE
jgi:hypothetical protein